MAQPYRTRIAAVVLVVALVGGAVPTAGASADVAGQQDACEFPYETTDATGTTVTVASVPDRIVALQPSDAQIAYEIGAAERVVGLPINPNTDYLANRSGRADVTNDDGTTDVEQVIDADPDLVLAANATPVETVDQLRSAGLTVYHFDRVESIQGIYDDVTETGRLTGECDGAATTVAETRDRIERVREAVADREAPPVLYTFFGFTAGADTHVHDVIETAGGRNVAAEAGVRGYRQLSSEVVVDRDPEWIVYPSTAERPRGAPYDETTAIEREQVMEVEANDINQPGPRVALVVEELARAFHPEAFGSDTATPAEPTDTVTATTTGETTATDGGTGADADEATDAVTAATETPTAADGAGFGVVAAAAGLLGLSALAGRLRGR